MFAITCLISVILNVVKPPGQGRPPFVASRHFPRFIGDVYPAIEDGAAYIVVRTPGRVVSRGVYYKNEKGLTHE